MNAKSPISTASAPSAIGPYSQGILAGPLVFVSGQLPVDPVSGQMVTGDIAAEARQALANVRAILEAAGSSLGQVVKTTVFLTDMNDFAVVNAAYAEFFSAPFPARACIAVAGLPKGARVEVEAVALAPAA
jgi:2-iminobutanoate/2-iminopropanoate deaminase